MIISIMICLRLDYLTLCTAPFLYSLHPYHILRWSSHCLSPFTSGTLVLMLPDMMHLCIIIGISVTMLAMTSYLTYGYRVYHMSDMGQAINFWMQFTLLSRDPKCVRFWGDAAGAGRRVAGGCICVCLIGARCGWGESVICDSCSYRYRTLCVQSLQRAA